MHPIDRTIVLAVLRVFRDAGVTRSGGSVGFDDLHTAWRSTGLRHHDLGAGIRSLRQSDCVRIDGYSASGDRRVTLLAAGESRLLGLPGILWGWLEKIGGARVLRAQARRRHGAALFRGVRSTDAAPAEMSGPVRTGPDLQHRRPETIRA